MYYVASILASRDGTHAHCSMNIKCSVYSRAATITLDGRYVRRLFEGGYYSKCGVYSRKYGIYTNLMTGPWSIESVGMKRMWGAMTVKKAFDAEEHGRKEFALYQISKHQDK